jgi:hypothetical protein
MSANDDMVLLEELAGRIEKQIELVRKGSFGGLERLTDECQRLVAKIKNAGLLEKPEHQTHRRRLTKLYQDLKLALSAQKDAAAEQLKSVGRHKRTLAIYRGNI